MIDIIGQIVLVLVIVWTISAILSVLIYIAENEDSDISNKVILIFPANLIFIIKYWWKAIITAIKS